MKLCFLEDSQLFQIVKTFCSTIILSFIECNLTRGQKTSNDFHAHLSLVSLYCFLSSCRALVLLAAPQALLPLLRLFSNLLSNFSSFSPYANLS